HGTLRPDVGRCAYANGSKAPERAGVRQEECGDLHRVGRLSRTVCRVKDKRGRASNRGQTGPNNPLQSTGPPPCGCGVVRGSPKRGGSRMTVTYDREITELLVIDPYNDFISEGGKIWDRLKGVAEANDCVPHMLQVLSAARKAGLRIFYALHHRY